MPSDVRDWPAGKGQNQPQLRIMRASHPQVNEKPRSAGVPAGCGEGVPPSPFQTNKKGPIIRTFLTF